MSPGHERIQVWCLCQRIHPVCQPEETHVDPRQREALPVPCLLQDLCPEADPENAYDCSPAGEAFQMQGGGSKWHLSQNHLDLAGMKPGAILTVILVSFRYAGSRLTECTTSSATCISTLAASPSSALTAPASSTWRATWVDTWKSNTASWMPR